MVLVHGLLVIEEEGVDGEADLCGGALQQGIYGGDEGVFQGPVQPDDDLQEIIFYFPIMDNSFSSSCPKLMSKEARLVS